MEYTYTNISAFNHERLKLDITASSMTDKSYQYSSWDGSTLIVKVVFGNSLSGADKILLDGIVANNDPSPLPPEEETVEIKLQRGQDLRQKWMGYQFNAVANTTTDYDLVMPFAGHIQGGCFYAGNSKTGDELSFIIMPGTSYSYAYIDTVPLCQGETFNPMEDFGMTGLIPINIPMKIKYKNTDSTDKLIVLKMLYRLAE